MDTGVFGYVVLGVLLFFSFGFVDYAASNADFGIQATEPNTSTASINNWSSPQEEIVTLSRNNGCNPSDQISPDNNDVCSIIYTLDVSNATDGRILTTEYNSTVTQPNFGEYEIRSYPSPSKSQTIEAVTRELEDGVNNDSINLVQSDVNVVELEFTLANEGNPKNNPNVSKIGLEYVSQYNEKPLGLNDNETYLITMLIFLGSMVFVLVRLL